MTSLRQLLRRLRGPLIYAALCGALMLALRQRAWEHVSTLTGDEWDPIRSVIRADHQGGEPLCILPSWTIGHATEDYRFRGFDRLENPEDAWEGRAEPMAGFWVVSQFGAFDPGSVPEDLYPYRSQVRLGQANIYVFRRQPIDDLPGSLLTRLDEATCVLQGPGRRRLDLEWSRTGFRVPPSFPGSDKMTHLGCRITEGRFGGRPQTGIWFHPPPANQYLALTWSRIKVAPWLEVGGGLVDHVTGRKAPPVKLTIILDGRELVTLEYPSERGWKRYAIATGLDDRPGRLSFKTWTENNHSRHFVFNARMSRTRPPGALVPSPTDSLTQ
jgi:hypothetical protein